MELYLIIMTFFIFVLGASIGSFLNVCIYRIPAGRSVISPPSACDNCGSRLKWYDMIPVLSALWLRGRCRVCGARFSVRHAFVEFLTGAVYVYIALPRIVYLLTGAAAGGSALSEISGGALSGSFWVAVMNFGGNFSGSAVGTMLDLLLMLVMASVLTVSAFTDIDHRIIPNRVVLFAAFVGLAALGAGAFTSSAPVFDRLASFCTIFVIFFAVSALTASLGAGDAKLFALLGLYHGSCAIYPVLGTFILAGIYSLVALVVLRRASLRTRLPLAPFIAASYIAVIPYIA